MPAVITCSRIIPPQASSQIECPATKTRTKSKSINIHVQITGSVRPAQEGRRAGGDHILLYTTLRDDALQMYSSVCQGDQEGYGIQPASGAIRSRRKHKVSLSNEMGSARGNTALYETAAGGIPDIQGRL